MLAFFASFLVLSGCSLWSDVSGVFVSNPSSGEESIESFVGSLKLRNGDPESMYRLAVHYQKTGRHDWAIEEFRNILAVEPAFARAYNGIGVSLDHYQKYALAQKTYIKALEIDPEMDYAWNNLGYSVLLEGKPAAAAAYFEKALALRQDNPRYMNNLALARRQMTERGISQADQLADLPQPRSDAPTKVRKKIAPPIHDRPSALVAEGNLAGTPGSMPAHAVMVAPGKGRVLASDHILPDAVQQTQSRRVVVQPFRAMADDVTFTITPVIPIQYAPRQSMHPAATIILEPPAVMPRKATPPKSHAVTMLVNPENFDHAIHHSDGPYIEIANGNGVTGMAATVKRFLIDKGFPVLRATNATHFGFRSTIVLYRPGSLQQAWHIAKEIPGEQNFEEVNDLGAATIAVKLILGKDLQPYYSQFKGRT
jgi:hypothetical protein